MRLARALGCVVAAGSLALTTAILFRSRRSPRRSRSASCTCWRSCSCRRSGASGSAWRPASRPHLLQLLPHPAHRPVHDRRGRELGRAGRLPRRRRRRRRRSRTPPRSRAREAEQRRREADLAAELARLLLGTPDPRAALPARRPSASPRRSEVDSAAVVLERVDRRRAARGDPARRARPLVVPAAAADQARERVAPALEALLAAALEREELHARGGRDPALRRSDDIKTAVLRSVSPTCARR